MKNLLLPLFFVLLVMGCENDSDESPMPAYTIEGKWLYPTGAGFTGLEGISNTMYLFEDGIRYTYYCIENDCESQYESFEAGDGNHIPGINNYTFKNDVLNVDLNFGNELVTPITFECDGGEAYFEAPGYKLVRLGSGCD